MEIITTSNIISVIMTGILSLIWLDIRSIRKEVTTQTEKYHACQKELPVKYADKKEVKNEITKLWEKSDKASDEISYLQGNVSSKH